ncbi:Uncharacterised protein [Mycobacteroides abscessus subsp. abscessus]|nr:Uncharacterised protein [Mycobacteroides abscessus subsp. abscessus]SLG05333.1 Uncharacterised protein [Mycobacteroides abscessus subsp. abscessus]
MSAYLPAAGMALGDRKAFRPAFLNIATLTLSSLSVRIRIAHRYEPTLGAS